MRTRAGDSRALVHNALQEHVELMRSSNDVELDVELMSLAKVLNAVQFRIGHVATTSTISSTEL